MMENNNDREVLLSVQHLQQYFKMGHQTLKAVDDINFDIYRGEVFGLVGESGCGKTTTGRSIIRLYNITGGSVYFKGQRICAGVNTYKEAIAEAKKDCSRRIAELGDKADPARVAELKAGLRHKIFAGIVSGTAVFGNGFPCRRRISGVRHGKEGAYFCHTEKNCSGNSGDLSVKLPFPAVWTCLCAVLCGGGAGGSSSVGAFAVVSENKCRGI